MEGRYSGQEMGDGKQRLLDLIAKHSKISDDIVLEEHQRSGKSKESIIESLLADILDEHLARGRSKEWIAGHLDKEASNLENDKLNPLSQIAAQSIRQTIARLSECDFQALTEQFQLNRATQSGDVTLKALIEIIESAEKPGDIDFVNLMLVNGDPSSYQAYQIVLKKYQEQLSAAESAGELRAQQALLKLNTLTQVFSDPTFLDRLIQAHDTMKDLRMFNEWLADNISLCDDYSEGIRSAGVRGYAGFDHLIESSGEAIDWVKSFYRRGEEPEFAKEASHMAQDLMIKSITSASEVSEKKEKIKNFLNEYCAEENESSLYDGKTVDAGLFDDLMKILEVDLLTDAFTKDYSKASRAINQLVQSIKDSPDIDQRCVAALDTVAHQCNLLDRNLLEPQRVFRQKEAELTNDQKEIQTYFDEMRQNAGTFARAIQKGLAASKVVGVAAGLGIALFFAASSPWVAVPAGVLGGAMVGKLLGWFILRFNRNELRQELFDKGFEFIGKTLFDRFENIEELKDPVVLRDRVGQLMLADRLLLRNMFSFISGKPEFGNLISDKLGEYTRSFDFIAGGVGAQSEKEKRDAYLTAQKTSLFSGIVLPAITEHKVYSTAYLPTIAAFGNEVDLCQTVIRSWANSYSNSLLSARNMAYDISDSEMRSRIAELKQGVAARNSLLYEQTKNRKYYRWQEILFASLPEAEFFNRGILESIFFVYREALQDRRKPSYKNMINKK